MAQDLSAPDHTARGTSNHSSQCLNHMLSSTHITQMSLTPHHYMQVHHWLHDTHQCYAVSRQHEFSKPTMTDPRLLASY